ncbi:MAG: hypothetical protein JWM10_4099 [Myxococcaceae bacterium]|nr:hypothetical protein [Myxococcaceae bacterium]
MLDLSTLPRAALEARCRRMERLANLGAGICDGLVELLAHQRAENAGLLTIIEEGTRDRSELSRQLANVTPFSALEALRSAEGWQETTPTIEEIMAHAEAFPVSEGDGEGETDDPNAPLVGGLWAFDGRDGVGLLELFRGQHGLPWVQYVDASIATADAELSDFVGDGTTTRWLRLTPDAHPVTRAVSK